MNNGNSPPEVRIERIDADAVCAQCGTVNPEDTLLCKTCGNNLRDQRARRVVGTIPPEALAEPKKLSLLTKLLALLGILVIIWVALNMNEIESRLVGIQTEESNGDFFWTSSPDRKIYEQLLSELRQRPVTAEESMRAEQAQAVNVATVDGRYTLIGANVLNRKLVLGQANVMQDGDRILFVAILENNGAEIRGEARMESLNRYVARDSAGILFRGKYYGASGLAVRSPSGGFECSGLCDVNDQIYSANAYRVPDL